MCLAIPGRVEELFARDGLNMARVNFGGVKRIACVEYTPGIERGDYVLVHVGFAISVLNEEEARRSYSLLSMDEVNAEVGDPQRQDEEAL